MTNKLKKSDIFGHDFKMTYNGEKLYTTWFGTMLTSTLNIIVLFYGAFLFVDLYTEKAQSTIAENAWFNMDQDKTGFNFGKAGFDFGIGFPTHDLPLDPRIGTWEFNYTTATRDGKKRHKNDENEKSYPCETHP